MDRSELIEDILRMTPAAADDEDRARPLLAKLTKEQLRQAHAGLSVLKQSGADVLASMAPAQRDEFASLLTGGGADAERVKQSLDQVEARVRFRAVIGSVWREFKKLYDAVRAGLPAPAVASHEFDSASAFQMAISSPTGGRALAVTAPGGVGKSNFVFETALRRFMELTGHTAVPRAQPVLDPTQTMEAFARMERTVSDTQPDVIVAMNRQGHAISRLIVSDLKLSTPVITVHGDAGQELRWSGKVPAADAVSKVFIVGHVAWSGKTIDAVVEQARQRFGHAEVGVAVLATSTRAAERTHHADSFTFHCISAAPKPRLPMDVTRLTIRNDKFHFAASEESGPLTFSAADLERARDGII